MISLRLLHVTLHRWSPRIPSYCMVRIRKLRREQHEALVAIDAQERSAIELELLESDHLATEDAYLRRKDRLCGKDVPNAYPEIEAARALLARQVRSRQERFDALRVAVLTGRGMDPSEQAQLPLLPGGDAVASMS